MLVQLAARRDLDRVHEVEAHAGVVRTHHDTGELEHDEVTRQHDASGATVLGADEPLDAEEAERVRGRRTLHLPQNGAVGDVLPR